MQDYPPMRFEEDTKPEYYDYHIVRPYCDVVLTLQVFGSGDFMVAGLRWLEGRIDRMGPKAMRAAIIRELAIIELACKESGVSEMRHSGDDRGWCLPDYEPMPGLPNGRRKRL